MCNIYIMYTHNIYKYIYTSCFQLLEEVCARARGFFTTTLLSQRLFIVSSVRAWGWILKGSLRDPIMDMISLNKRICINAFEIALSFRRGSSEDAWDEPSEKPQICSSEVPRQNPLTSQSSFIIGIQDFSESQSSQGSSDIPQLISVHASEILG